MKAAPVAVALGHAGMNAVRPPGLQRDLSERVVADPGDERAAGSRASGGDGLVGTLAAGTDREARSGNGLADRRQATGAKCEVGHKDTEDRNAVSAHARLLPVRRNDALGEEETTIETALACRDDAIGGPGFFIEGVAFDGDEGPAAAFSAVDLGLHLALHRRDL